MHSLSLLSLALLSPLLVNAQLSGHVGPLTSSASKASTKTCNVQNYGAKADKETDIGSAIEKAWSDCSEGGVVYIPSGDYAMSSRLKLSGGKASAIQLDGIIYRSGSDGGNLFMIEHSSDFEFFSSTSKGAIQGLGYEFHKDGNLDGPRLLRFYDVTDFSVHDVALVDSPAFHLSLDTCKNAEVYNMAIRGGDSGGLDGVDVWSENVWVHDVEVTNKDECVTVKSPANNILVENIYCNWSGGCAMGSLGADTNISDVVYRNVYTWKSNQMYMIKSNGGSGSVSNLVLENFIGYGNAYSLDIDGEWSSMSTVSGDGVQLNNITVRNWKGTEEDGAARGPIKIVCAAKAPCTDITIDDFALWTESGDEQTYSCENGFGSGFCLQNGDGTSTYSTIITETAAPTGYDASSMPNDLSTAFGTDASIPIPTIPTSFFPGATPYSSLAGAASGSAAKATSFATVSRSRHRRGSH
ncbi:RGase A [Aspergillus pseudonomiae]|uniref:rhamnogalacturonan hydrolase n=1 Tax=Aspergillus pseudonomiae TaxID=1506151 RepID=A0A5N6I878_9EURO|nr:RGase A [Aspergillus pseudonomiae]KAB8262875.1 RGase A [Aspergillus pseudonomiae]KAE8406281.1 RGase A [Aspergillus pseudonomiae]